jgi:hypothetical protein
VPTCGKETSTQDFIFYGPFAFTAVDEKRLTSFLLRGPLDDFSQNHIYNEDLFQRQYIYEKTKNKNKELTTIILFVWLAVGVSNKEKGFIC